MKHYGLIDLHLHLDGSLSPESVRQLAALQGIPVPESEEGLLEMLRVSPGCRDLNEYLEKFDFPCSLLQTAEAVTLSVANLTRQLREQGLLYAEIRFAPQLHTRKGLTQQQVVAAAVAGLDPDFPANLILCCMRGSDNLQANLETVAVAEAFLGKGVCAVDLAGAEALFPTADFDGVFALASEKGIPLTIHAGEAAGPESVWQALKHRPKRIGHGVRSLEDPALTAHLRDTGTVLELCPTSNLNTGIFPDLKNYPLGRYLAAGVKVTVNTDNITVSGVTLQAEAERVKEALSLTDMEMSRLLHTAAEASFAPPAIKEMLHTRLTEKGFL